MLPPPRVDNRYYVYCHVKRTDGLTFYVGKGCGQRAWSVDGRTKAWIAIAAEHGRTVHILRAGLTEREALDLERALIADAAKQGLTLANVCAGTNPKPKIKRGVRPKKPYAFGLSKYHQETIRNSILSLKELATHYGLSTKQIKFIKRRR